MRCPSARTNPLTGKRSSGVGWCAESALDTRTHRVLSRDTSVLRGSAVMPRNCLDSASRVFWLPNYEMKESRLRAWRWKLYRAVALLAAGACTEAHVMEPDPARHLSTGVNPSQAVEQFRARADALESCQVSGPGAEPAVEAHLRSTRASVRVPGDFRRIIVPRSGGMERWITPERATLTISTSKSGRFVIADATSAYVDERRCKVSGHFGPWAVHLYMLVPRGAEDTAYVATAELAAGPELWIGAGVVAPSRATRDRGLRVVQTFSYPR